MKVKYQINGKTMDRDSFLEGSNGVEEIIQTRQFPGLQTDDEFMAGRGTLADQLGDQTLKVVNAAQRNGYRPKHTDVYLPAMARFPGDPQAFIQHDSARGKVKKTLEARGWGCEGSVKVKARQTEPKRVKLADDLAHEEITALRQRDKHARKANLKELKQHVAEKHGSK